MCKIVLHAAWNFSSGIQHTHLNPPTERKQFWKLQEQIFTSYRRKRKPPSQTGSLFLWCSNKSTSLATTMRSPRREFRQNPWCTWLAHAGAHERIMKMTMLSTYLLSKHTRWRALLLEMCTSVLRLDVCFGVLALASSGEFRWKTVETVTSWHLWLDNTVCP